MNIYKMKNVVAIEDMTAEEWEQLKKLDEEKFLPKKILPRPVIRDGNGKLIKDHTPRDFFLKLQEEIFEAVQALEIYKRCHDYAGTIVAKAHFAEEIADVITVCISYLNAHGYDENKRSEIFAKVNEKNEKRGYFKESD